MKRLFQKTSSASSLSRSPNKQSTVTSPDSSGDGSPKRRERSRERRSYSPEKLAAVFRKPSPDKRAAQPPAASTVLNTESASERVLKRAASASISDDELHGKVVEYMTAASEAAQDAALRDIHTAILEDVATTGVRMRVSQKDTDKLISVCSQRLRLAFQHRLDVFNAAMLQASTHAPPPFLNDSDDGVERFVVALDVLKDVLSEDRIKAANHVILVVSERLPSTLVKVLKACAQSGGQSVNDGRVADSVLAVLSRLIGFQETVHELSEASTLHRLFHLTFDAKERQLDTLQLIEVLVRSTQGTLWGGILAHIHEHQCLLELLSTVSNTEGLVKVISICAHVLRTAYERSYLALHKQLRIEQFYVNTIAVFEATFDVDGQDGQQHQDNLRVAIGELCMSGSESAMVMGEVTNDQCFALSSEKVPTKKSSFNVEAFMLVCQILDFLHQRCSSGGNQHLGADGTDPTPSCQQLECQYIQKIGRLIAENRFDYVLIRRTGIMEQLLRRLNKLPDLSKHAVGSVLAATAIDANVVPYSELATIAVYISHATQTVTTQDRSTDLLVLLGFVVNLLRFHDAYRSILRTTGVLGAVVSLFHAHTMLFSSDDVTSTKINVAYPTSQLKIGHSSWYRRHSPGSSGSDWILPVNEKNLVMFLTSHCRQNSSVRKIETRQAVDHRVFALVIEVLTVFADQATMEVDGHLDGADDDDAVRVGLCDISFLECVCILLANKQYQDNALLLWAAIVRIALRIKKQNTSTYNAVNCFLQSLRYVGLSLYYKNEPEVKFVLQPSVEVLYNGLRFLETSFRPEPALDRNHLKRKQNGFSALRMLSKVDRDRLLLALVDCGGLYTCLALCCALAHAWEEEGQSDGPNTSNSFSDSAFILTTRLIHILVTSSATMDDLFNCTITFQFYGTLLNQYLSLRISKQTAYADISQANDSFCRSLWMGLVGFAIDDYETACSDVEQDFTGDKTSRKITEPGAIIVLVQLIRMWSSRVHSAEVDRFLRCIGDLLDVPENARVCGLAGLPEVLLESFATMSNSLSTLHIDDDSDLDGLRMSLLNKGSSYHAVLLRILESAVAGGISHIVACRWVKLIVDASTTLRNADPMANEQLSIRITPLLNVLTQLAIGTLRTSSERIPSISFDTSHDGFAQMQIPEVLLRAQAPSPFQVSGQSTSPASSSSSFAALTSKAWPPPDGYSVMVWFRIDAVETKDAREKHYWDKLMKNICILCLKEMKDETALKCSHRACKACHEALVHCGGECVVCNPPMFYLFRFRSGDTKSVSEMFLRGTKLFMRTSATTKTGIHQFSHTPLQVGRWYHAVIVHSRQRFQASQVSLYLNGLLQETVKISYPSSISSGQPLSGLVGIPSQARRTSTSCWTIGSFYFVEDPISPHIVNAVFAVGPSYSGLYVGSSGSNEVLVSGDHLSVENLLLLDEYTRDPIRTLIESVEAAERSGKNSILRSSLSLASAASSAAAAIVQDIRTRGTSAGIFGRIPSAVPIVSIPLVQDRVTLVYSSSTASGLDFSVIPCGKLDGRPLAQLLGGAEIKPSFYLADTLHDLSGSGARYVYIILEQAATAVELELAAELLWQTLRNHPKNLMAMETEHGYGVVNYLLHQKPGKSLTVKTLVHLFRIVGIDIDEETRSSLQTVNDRESAIRNLVALQHFILDYSLWQNASTSIQKTLFSTLYASMMAGGDEFEALRRERNRAQLQSLSIVRQLLYVFLDPEADGELLRVIADLILVCLTGSSASNRNDSSNVEANFADIASFLASSLSPRFARSRDVFDVHASTETVKTAAQSRHSPRRVSPRHRQFEVLVDLTMDMQSPVDRYCLSPRGKSTRHGNDPDAMNWANDNRLLSPSSNPASPKAPSSPASHPMSTLIVERQTQTQDMLLDILTKAVQKHDLKENRERDELEGLYVEGSNGSQLTTSASGASSSITAAQRLQIPTATTKLVGFRKVLSPRWIGYFLFPVADSLCTVTIAPSTVIAALKLLAALLNRPRYETVFRKDGYYRLLAQGLPCDHRAFLALGSSFPFDQMWYSLFCMLLGPPVDGMPHTIQFDMYFLTKDFALNVQRDRLVNGSMIWVILALLRRHFDDPVSFAALRSLRISPEKSIMAQVDHVLYAKTPDGTNLCHTQVLDFLYHVYTSMPALQKLLVLSHASSSTSHNTSAAGGGESKLRGEILEELSLLACSAARAELFVKYAPSEKHVHQALLNQKRDLNASEFAACTVEITEQSASEDGDGEDPFQHPVSVRAIKILVAILCDFLVLHSKGVDHVESFFDNHLGSALAPPLHDGLQLRFQTLVMMSLLEQVRAKFADESVLSEHKGFAFNIKEFMTLAIQKMHMWQRAQHGDACPTAFACCGDTFHFSGGPFVLLDLALYFLGDTSAGATASTSSASASSTIGQMIQDKLNSSSKSGKPQKRRLTLKGMILGKVQFVSSKSAELEGLASSMYSAINAVILHVLQGHGSEVSDDECETLLQLIHLHRDVVLNARNTQDREFLVCLCRFLLQLLETRGGEGRTSVGECDHALQEIAAQIWIDLMQLQRPLMVELLTVELRRAGGSPYVVNLMKNGFDVLLECCHSDSDPSMPIIESAAFKKFKGWLDIVGPPLKELETNLDRVFVRRMVEAKEVVRDAWVVSHKRHAQRLAKETKRFESRFEWIVNMERGYLEALVEAQQKEFQRQLKWRQDRIDRQKFHARQWQKLRYDLFQQSLRNSEGGELSGSYAYSALTQRGRQASVTKQQRISWLLDATEGPSRMRKRLIAKVQVEGPFEATRSSISPTATKTFTNGHKADYGGFGSVPYPTRRRYSESDVDHYARALATESLLDPPVHIQLRPPMKDEQTRGEQIKGKKSRPVSRRLSFENVLKGADFRSDSADENSCTVKTNRVRRESSLSATNDQVSDEEDEDEDERDANFDDVDDADAVDEKLRPLLVPGDEIVDMFDCLRVDGMDACPGVFILCSDHLYIVDNYQLVRQYGPSLPNQRGYVGSSDTMTTARVMEVSTEAPTRLERRLSLRFQLPSPAIDGPQTPSGVLTMQRSTFTHQCRFWAYDDVVELHKRRHQLRHVALELFAHDGRNYLITFESPQQRESVFHSLITKCPNVRGAGNGMDRTITSGDLYSQLKKLLRQNMTERWISHEITNFEYLMHLNTLAGRSYNDLTQYPVFPWVLSDYTSPTLDLTDPGVYRDLTKPMGALYREDEFRTRYESLAEGGEESDSPMGVKPFHYGTHYSSAGIVLHYLMRMEPFTTHFLRLQGGKFDHADRLFSSISSAWKSAAGVDNAHNGTQDVKELTPEFYYLPTFLTNLNHYDFGADQSGLVVDDVELPPWANGSPQEFVRLNREALESPHVSANLHNWIDLIFGYKQQGPAAVDACNVFYHLTYEGAVDLDAITDLAMRRAMVDQISEFGQTPSQLFKSPHPPRVRLSTAVPSVESLGYESSAISSSNSLGSPQPSGGLSFSTGSGRTTLTSSFIEGSDIVSRMHSMLTNNSSLGSSSLLDDTTAILDFAAMLQQEPRRDVGVNPVVAAHRGHHQPANLSSSMAIRTRQLSSGIPAAPIHQLAIASASVTRDERVAAVSDRCLLIPPRHHDFFAWGFTDQSLKVLSTGVNEVAHGGDSKVVATFEIEFSINVACMTSDGRMLIAGGAVAPVVRLWQFGASKKSLVSAASSGVGVGRKRAYSVGLHTSGQSARSLVPLATLCSPSHKAPITAVQVCRAYSVVVSGCAGGVAVLWDLNRLRYSRTLSSLQVDDSGAIREPISAIAINEITGDIAVACGAVFGVFDVNGELLARLRSETLLHDSQYPRAPVTSMTVNQSETSAWCREKVVITGHADGVLCVWAFSHTGYGDSEVSIELKGRHMISKTLAGNTSTSRSAITSVLLSNDERKLFTGNADGLLTLWTPIVRPTTPTKAVAANTSPLAIGGLL